MTLKLRLKVGLNLEITLAHRNRVAFQGAGLDEIFNPQTESRVPSPDDHRPPAIRSESHQSAKHPVIGRRRLSYGASRLYGNSQALYQ